MEYIAKNVKPKREDEKRKIKKDKIGA